MSGRKSLSVISEVIKQFLANRPSAEESYARVCFQPCVADKPEDPVTPIIEPTRLRRNKDEALLSPRLTARMNSPERMLRGLPEIRPARQMPEPDGTPRIGPRRR